MSSWSKMYKILSKNLGKEIPRETLHKTTGISDYARVLRAKRSEEGYNIETTKNGYILHALKPKPGFKKSTITKKLRYEILRRDRYRCQICGRGQSDGTKLHVDHKHPKDLGGSNEESNLWTLCRECNEGKKNFYSDQTNETMKKIITAKSGKKRLKIIFEANPNKELVPSFLSAISQNREWTREIRFLREDGLNINPLRKGKKEWVYIYTP